MAHSGLISAGCPTFPTGEVHGYVTFVYSPSRFYFQRMSKDDTFDDLHNEIFQCRPHPKFQNFGQIELGDIVLAPSASDKWFYRAQVVFLMPETEELQVSFLDIGNLQIVSFNDIR